MKEITRDYSARKEGHARWVDKLRTPAELEKRFWDKVFRQGLNDCWPWQGAKGGTLPYGIFNFMGTNTNAHRVAYLLTYGPFDESLDVLHRCDNPPCCNPRHLFLGTAHDNIQDAIQKGRWKNPSPRKGESNPIHKLTEKEVLEIRRLHSNGCITQRMLAKQFGVSFQTINVVVLRKIWTHI